MRPSPASTAATVVVVARRLATPARPAAFRRLAASPARRLPATVSSFSRAPGMHPALLQKQRSRALHTTTRPVVAPASSASAAALSSAPTRRLYHFFDHPSEPDPADAFSAAEQAILAAAYPHIPAHGFSEHALARGARDAGYPAISAAILPDGGVFSLVRWHLVTQRAALAAHSRALFGDAAMDAADAADPAPPLSPAAVADRAERLTWARLLGNTAVIGRWQEALAVLAQPRYAPAAVRELARLADEIWAQAGDTAVDPTWYTKRAALGSIYAASELFMTTDRSPGFADTRAFLHRRCGEAQALGGRVRAVGEWVGFTASAGLNVLRSKGVGI